MDVAVSRRNTSYCDRTLPNYWNRAKNRRYFCRESKVTTS